MELRCYPERSSKASSIPSEWKADIDSILETDLLAANRYFAANCPSLAACVERAIESPPAYFLNQLQGRWSWHHAFFEGLVEPALGALLEERNAALSPLQVRALAEVYQTTSLVDQATLIMTAAIKGHVNRWTTPERLSYLSPEERSMVITPPTPSFWIQYRREHLEYLLLLRTDPRAASAMRSRLLREYHANDEVIFAGRLAKLDRYKEYTVVQMRELIKGLQADPNYNVAHGYLTLERPELRAIRDILEFDNIEEYRILKSLEGISGFVLRKAVLKYLEEARILPSSSSIYSHDDARVAEGLQKLYGYRRDFYDKRVQSFRQTTAETCSAVCLMQCLHRLGLVSLNREIELEIYEETRSRRIPGSHYSALASLARRAGLEALLLHSEAGRFKKGSLSQPLFAELMHEYAVHARVALEQGAREENGARLDPERIRKLLEEGYTVCVAGSTWGALHSVLATGYTQEKIIIHEPLTGKVENWSPAALARFMETPIGRWALAIRKPTERLDELLRACPKFQSEARTFLTL